MANPNQREGFGAAPCPSSDEDDQVSHEEFLDYVESRFASARRPKRRAPRVRPSEEWPPAEVRALPEAERMAWMKSWRPASRPHFGYYGLHPESREFEAPPKSRRFRELDEIYEKLVHGSHQAAGGSLDLVGFRRAVWQAAEGAALFAGLTSAADTGIDDVRDADSFLAEGEAIASIFVDVEPYWWTRIVHAPAVYSSDRQRRLDPDVGSKAWQVWEAALAFRQALTDLRSDFVQMGRKERGRPSDRLSRATLREFYRVWKRGTGGRRQARDNATSFEDFAEVAWRAVGIPFPDKADLSEWLRELIKEGSWRKNPIGK